MALTAVKIDRRLFESACTSSPASRECSAKRSILRVIRRALGAGPKNLLAPSSLPPSLCFPDPLPVHVPEVFDRPHIMQKLHNRLLVREASHDETITDEPGVVSSASQALLPVVRGNAFPPTPSAPPPSRPVCMRWRPPWSSRAKKPRICWLMPSTGMLTSTAIRSACGSGRMTPNQFMSRGLPLPGNRPGRYQKQGLVQISSSVGPPGGKVMSRRSRSGNSLLRKLNSSDWASLTSFFFVRILGNLSGFGISRASRYRGPVSKRGEGVSISSV